MSDCRRTADRLTSYVDGLLPASERAEVDRHLAHCPPCRRAAGHEQGARAVLRETATRLRAEPLPPGLRTRCEALAREHTAPPRGFWGIRLVPLSLTAVLVLFTIFAVFTLATQRSNTVFASRVTADLVRCLTDSAAPETAAADATRLEARLAQQYGWNVHVPPSSATGGVELVGARSCLYGNALIPHVMYRTNGQDVSLYMLEGETRDEADVVTLGYRSRVWSRGATTFVLVSPAEAGELTTAVRYLKQEAH